MLYIILSPVRKSGKRNIFMTTGIMGLLASLRPPFLMGGQGDFSAACSPANRNIFMTMALKRGLPCFKKKSRRPSGVAGFYLIAIDWAIIFYLLLSPLQNPHRQHLPQERHHRPGRQSRHRRLQPVDLRQTPVGTWPRPAYGIPG